LREEPTLDLFGISFQSYAVPYNEFDEFIWPFRLFNGIRGECIGTAILWTKRTDHLYLFNYWADRFSLWGCAILRRHTHSIDLNP